ncbi:hypothetical protein [Marinobacter salarius]|uniref:hypothetical protein n=1 Tax=Marinobacter TaxID=2742 RepID=UPI0025A3DFDC|nr:hypothetical protein [Marinobacter salarius]MDM8181767.1 hypothetical protein [Marinobacter salarius]
MIVPWLLRVFSGVKSKNAAFLAGAAVVLFFVAASLSYLFTELQEKSSLMKDQAKAEVFALENNVENTAPGPERDRLISVLESARKTADDAGDLEQFVSILNLMVIFFGLSIAANYMTDATYRRGFTEKYYEIPDQINRRLDRLENQQMFMNVLLTSAIVVFGVMALVS